jgi:4-aminobutyrate aminotransferase-like enzyme
MCATSTKAPPHGKCYFPGGRGRNIRLPSAATPVNYLRVSVDVQIMKDLVPSPPPVVRNDVAAVQALFQQNVVPSYGRFEIVLSHGAGSYLYDLTGRRYLDLGGGIAVSSLGHAHPAITEALVEQSRKVIHCSNFYYHEPQGRLAQALVSLIGPGKCFFGNSGVEANEGLFKLARKFGHDEAGSKC